MLFSEVRVTAVADTPVLLLREQQGERDLAGWITAARGDAIPSAPRGSDGGPPTLHDLMIDALAVLDAVVEAVHITGEDEGVFSAHVVIGGTVVPARVSDAVALALRCGAPILADPDLLDEVGVTGAPQPGPPGLADGGATDEEMEQFRAFLDNITPEDFGPSRDQP